MVRRRRAEPGQQSISRSDEVQSGQLKTEIVGVTTNPRHDVASGGTGLYEFWTTDGVPVYLHDTTVVNIELRPPDRRLVVRFEYGDPQWTPPEAAQTPVIVMEFDEVTIAEWLPHSGAGNETPAVVNGQVEYFTHFDRNAFRLTTYQSDIQFTARKLTVRLMPRQA